MTCLNIAIILNEKCVLNRKREKIRHNYHYVHIIHMFGLYSETKRKSRVFLAVWMQRSFHRRDSFYRVCKMSSKRSCSRKDLSLREKIALLDEMKKQPECTSLRKLKKILKVPKSTISHLRATEKQIREEWSCAEAENRKRKRKGKEPQVDEGLNLWFSKITERGVHITGPMLKEKAEELA